MAVRYISAARGSDTTGDGSFESPWYSVNKYQGEVGTESLVQLIVLADGVYEFDEPQIAHRNVIVGANANGVVDGTRPVFRAVAAMEAILDGSAGGQGRGAAILLDLDANNLANYAFLRTGSRYNAAGLICRNAILDGASCLVITHSLAVDNGRDGIAANTATFCFSMGNGRRGISLAAGHQSAGLVACRNGDAGITVRGYGTVSQSLADSNSGAGFRNVLGIGGHHGQLWVNCISTRNQGNGFQGGVSQIGINCFVGDGEWANGSDVFSEDTDFGTVRGDPRYTDPDADDPDYTPRPGSPLIDAGIELPFRWGRTNLANIGAIVRSGGGGRYNPFVGGAIR